MELAKYTQSSRQALLSKEGMYSENPSKCWGKSCKSASSQVSSFNPLADPGLTLQKAACNPDSLAAKDDRFFLILIMNMCLQNLKVMGPPIDLDANNGILYVQHVCPCFRDSLPNIRQGCCVL